jgi:hypothetical protein
VSNRQICEWVTGCGWVPAPSDDTEDESSERMESTIDSAATWAWLAKALRWVQRGVCYNAEQQGRWGSYLLNQAEQVWRAAYIRQKLELRRKPELRIHCQGDWSD